METYSGRGIVGGEAASGEGKAGDTLMMVELCFFWGQGQGGWSCVGWVGPEAPGEQENDRVRFLFLKRSPWYLVDKRLWGSSAGGSRGPRRRPPTGQWGCREVGGQRQVALGTPRMSGEGRGGGAVGSVQGEGQFVRGTGGRRRQGCPELGTGDRTPCERDVHMGTTVPGAVRWPSGASALCVEPSPGGREGRPPQRGVEGDSRGPQADPACRPRGDSREAAWRPGTGKRSGGRAGSLRRREAQCNEVTFGFAMEHPWRLGLGLPHWGGKEGDGF